MNRQTKITPQPGILDITPYVGGAATAPGANRVFKLSANENPHGPSPAAIDAYRGMADQLHLYPEDSAPLREVIASVHGIDADRIVCGSGSDEIISLLLSAYAGPGDEVVYSAHGFMMYPLSTMAVGATPVAAPERNLTVDVDAMLAACTDATRMMFLANPNNPTGTMLPHSEVVRLADSVPDTVLLVLDAAYAEYIRDPDYDGGLALATHRDNVFMTRTFSKIYGLGALRLGWGYGPDHVIDVLNRIRGPFNVTAPALAAGEAAMKDQDHVARCVITNEVWRDWLSREIDRAGLPVVPSAANFVLVDAADADTVNRLYDHLAARGLVARKVAGYGLPGHLRISVGDEEACRLVAEAIHAFKR